jgi:putative transport protein
MKARGMTEIQYVVTSAPEAAVEIQSSVPWIGFPVGYAVSGILLTVFGYFAMVLAQ